jgi:hypothetical protein
MNDILFKNIVIGVMILYAALNQMGHRPSNGREPVAVMRVHAALNQMGHRPCNGREQVARLV